MDEIKITWRPPTEASTSEVIKRNVETLLFNVAIDISHMPMDPQFEMTPTAIVVGSYARSFDPNAQDFDIEVYGVSAEHFLEHVHFLDCFKDKIAKEEIGGNAYKVLDLTLVDGRKFSFSIPIRESENPQRYNPQSVIQDPELTFEEASQRRNFSINCYGFNPITREQLDPFQGRNDEANKILRAVNPNFTSDPIRLPNTLKMLAELRYSPDPVLREHLLAMVKDPGDRSNRNFDDQRFRYEISRWFVSSAKPSHIFNLAKKYEFIGAAISKLAPLIESEDRSIWFKAFELVDEAWDSGDYQSLPEPVAIGRQIGALFAGITVARKLVDPKALSSQEEFSSELKAFAEELVMSVSSEVPNLFEEMLEIANYTAFGILHSRCLEPPRVSDR